QDGRRVVVADWGGGELYRERWYVARRIGPGRQHRQHQLFDQLRAHGADHRESQRHHGHERGERGSRSRRLHGHPGRDDQPRDRDQRERNLHGAHAGQPLGGAEWGGGELYRERWYVAYGVGQRRHQGRDELVSHL